jgi:hypothetical protein
MAIPIKTIPRISCPMNMLPKPDDRNSMKNENFNTNLVT